LAALAMGADRPRLTAAERISLRAMVVAGIQSLTRESDEAAAWRHFVSSNDVVGIKISAQSGPLQSTRRAVVKSPCSN